RGHTRRIVGDYDVVGTSARVHGDVRRTNASSAETVDSDGVRTSGRSNRELRTGITFHIHRATARANIDVDRAVAVVDAYSDVIEAGTQQDGDRCSVMRVDVDGVAAIARRNVDLASGVLEVIDFGINVDVVGTVASRHSDGRLTGDTSVVVVVTIHL